MGRGGPIRGSPIEPRTLVCRDDPSGPDPGPLLGLLPEASPLAWIRRGEGLVGWGHAASFRTQGSGRFGHAERWWRELVGTAVVRDEVGLPGCGPVAFGSFAFDDGGTSSVLVLPDVVVGHRAGRWWVTTVGVQGALPPGAVLQRSTPFRRPVGRSIYQLSGRVRRA